MRLRQRLLDLRTQIGEAHIAQTHEHSALHLFDGVRQAVAGKDMRAQLIGKVDNAVAQRRWGLRTDRQKNAIQRQRVRMFVDGRLWLLGNAGAFAFLPRAQQKDVVTAGGADRLA